MKTKRLHQAITAVLATASAVPAIAQTATQPATTPDPTDPGVACTGETCNADGQVILRVRTRGEERPETAPTTPVTSAALQPDRKVTVEMEAPDAQPGRAVASATWSVQLPQGGVVWATEDPDLGQPELSVSASSLLAFDGTRITKPVKFYGYTNYGAFIKRAEALVYRASDRDLVQPLATVPLTMGTVIEGEWDGALSDAAHLQAGDELVYVVRVWSDEKTYDETFPQRMQLLRPEEVEAGNQRIQRGMDQSRVGSMTADAAEKLRLVENTFGRNSLRRQNIPVHGSRVRVSGRNLPEGATLTINQQNIPVDLERKFVTEYLLPVGKYTFDVVASGGPALPAPAHRQLDVDVSGRYFFGVALADFTLSGGRSSGAITPQNPDGRFDKNSLTEGRLAFYAKGKYKGRYLITAQADTREHEISRMFRGFTKAYPQDIFRRLDPDNYYPVFGDDSRTYRDVDTMGRFYLRVDWDKNQALWGNYQTGLTGTEYAQYVRSLYGAAVTWRSARTTDDAEPGTFVRAFASEAQSAPGHNEFIGTGGSLYYLKHTDLLPGSDKVTLEVRDTVTGLVENRIELVRGADYEIDSFQGRIILTRPLAQVTRENIRTLTRDRPLDGYAQVLLVDYEYVPQGFSSGERAMGLRAKHWFGDHVGLGATYVTDGTRGDYKLAGADITLRAGRGTYLKVERSQTRSSSVPVFFSDNGGLSFGETNLGKTSSEGTATAVEARANFKELGWTQRDWSAGAWWRNIGAGYSTARLDNQYEVRESGVEVLGNLSDAFRLYARASRAERGADSLTQAQLTADWRINDRATLSAELRRVDEERAATGSVSGTLLAARYQQRIGSALDVYATGQFTLDDDGGKYAKNNALTVGGKYNFANLSTLGGEITAGNRGNAAQINGEWRISPEHSFYGAYTYSTDRTGYDPLFHPQANSGWTLGQRWRLSSRANLFNESQFLKARRESGLSHTFGMDFYPDVGWSTGFTLQKAQLDRGTGQIDRSAISLYGGHTSNALQWQSKLEYRRDTGAEQRQQWVTTNWATWKPNESWRFAGRFNYSRTNDDLNPQAGARFTEGNFGFAWRPWNSTKYALLGKYTFLYDVSSLPQAGNAVRFYDQRSRILSVEGIYHPSANWEFAAKAARRDGQVRMQRLAGDQWMDSGATFAAAQARYGIGNTDWNVLGEYRWLKVQNGGTRSGALIAVDRDITDNLRIGVGYNFTDFSDDLTDFDYDHKGWFLNVAGRY